MVLTVLADTLKKYRFYNPVQCILEGKTLYSFDPAAPNIAVNIDILRMVDT